MKRPRQVGPFTFGRARSAVWRKWWVFTDRRLYEFSTDKRTGGRRFVFEVTILGPR